MEGEYVGTVPLCTGSREDKQRRHGFGPLRVIGERCTRLASVWPWDSSYSSYTREPRWAREIGARNKALAVCRKKTVMREMAGKVSWPNRIWACCSWTRHHAESEYKPCPVTSWSTEEKVIFRVTQDGPARCYFVSCAEGVQLSLHRYRAVPWGLSWTRSEGCVTT